MRSSLSLPLALAAVSFASPLHANLVISEVLYNEVGGDTKGEWIEIYNNGSSALNLEGYKIGDEETSGGTSTGESLYVFPSGAVIAPGEVQIVSINAGTFFDIYGFLPTYELGGFGTNDSVPDLTVDSLWDADGGQIAGANGGDEMFLLDPSNNLVDAMGWDSTFAFNPGLADTEADGQSYYRINPNVDTDTAADWALGSPSSPGVVVVPEPVTASLVAVGALALALRRRR